MAIRLWPQDYERKDHITKSEKSLLRNAARNFKGGHIAVGIDPVGMSNATIHMGMYISPEEGLLTFSIYSGQLQPSSISSYMIYVDMVETKIYDRLVDSKMLIIRDGSYKMLKFPYKHVIIFPEEKIGKTAATKEQLNQLLNYVTYDFFRPITSNGQEKTVAQLGLFAGVRKPYDKSFSSLSDLECRAIFERLAPEYTVIMNEVENVHVVEKINSVTEKDMRITGKELEYKTFFLDEYQVAQVNDMGKGHRVILANPGAGKSVLLLSKAFKYASLYKESKVLLTCYNGNLADSYAFKRACANFGDNQNLFIMTFHKLVNKIYQECMHSHCESFFATDEEVQNCINYVKNGKVDIRFKAIFIDEVQNFNPLYLELCYLLLDKSDNHVFLMAGDLNQSVRAKYRRGDVPWKQIRGVNLDFTGRVRYIEKNYRNSREIGEYVFGMLTLMNKRLEMLGMINQMEYEYNSFTLGDNPTIALNVRTGINKKDIKKTVISAVTEISAKYKISYSDIAVLFPFRQIPYRNYYFLYWLKQALDEAGIPYSMIINDGEASTKTKYSNASGIIISTIESSLGLDFKAVVLAGLYPYSYVNIDGQSGKEIKSWVGIKSMTEAEQNAVQSQMRSIYTACSRARDVLYVLSDINVNSPMEEILRKTSPTVTVSQATVPVAQPKTVTTPESKTSGSFRAKNSVYGSKNATALEKASDGQLKLVHVKDKCIVEVVIKENMKPMKLRIDLAKYPKQTVAIGKKIGEEINMNPNVTYVITGIYTDK